MIEGTTMFDVFNAIYPVGSIYMSVNDTNPSVLFGGTWEAWGTGRTIVGVNSDDTDFETSEQTGGNKQYSGAHIHDLQGEGACARIYSTGSKLVGNVVSGVTSYTPQYTFSASTPAWEMSANQTSGVIVSGNSKQTTIYVDVLQPYITCYMWKRTA